MFPLSFDGYMSAKGARLQEENGSSWIVSTLPYIEEQAMYDRFRAAAHLTIVLTRGRVRPAAATRGSVSTRPRCAN